MIITVSKDAISAVFDIFLKLQTNSKLLQLQHE